MRLRRRALLFAAGVLIAGGVGLWVWWQSQRASLGTAYDFLAAVQSRDWATVARLIQPEERQTLRLNEERVKAIGEKLIAPLWQQLGGVKKVVSVENPFLPTPEEEAFFRPFRFYRILREGDKEGAMVIVAQTEEGWRVAFSFFVFTLVTEGIERQRIPRQQLDWLPYFGITHLVLGKETLPLQPLR